MYRQAGGVLVWWETYSLGFGETVPFGVGDFDVGSIVFVGGGRRGGIIVIEKSGAGIGPLRTDRQ